MVEDDRARRRHADGRGSHDRRHPVEGRVVEVVIGDDAYAVRQPRGPGRVEPGRNNHRGGRLEGLGNGRAHLAWRDRDDGGPVVDDVLDEQLHRLRPPWRRLLDARSVAAGTQRRRDVGDCGRDSTEDGRPRRVVADLFGGAQLFGGASRTVGGRKAGRRHRWSSVVESVFRAFHQSRKELVGGDGTSRALVQGANGPGMVWIVRPLSSRPPNVAAFWAFSSRR